MKFTTTEEVVLAGEGLFNNAKASYTGTDVYVAINAVESTLSYSIGGVQCKSLTKNFEAGKIYNLGTLTAPEVSDFGVVGSFQGWDVAVGKPVKMYQTLDGWVVAKGVELYKSDEFKIVKGNSWDVSYGFTSKWVMEDNVEVLLDGTENIQACKNGEFDIYFNGETKMAKYVCVDEYTDLMVNITIKNDAKWSNYTITLKEGDTIIVDNATVTGNKYAVSGDYIGETLSYTLSNGSKTMEGNVTISKTGATIELEEVDVVTTIVYKNVLANQQTYWGNTTCLYVWGSGSSLDNAAWPGNTMTKTADHTWSITIPSSLVGKTINYIINNGGDWKSADKTLTIQEGENVLTDQMLGIH